MSRRLKSRDLALASIFAALYVVASTIPGIRLPMLPKISIQVEALLATLFGVILGPYLGFVSTLLGVFLAWLLPPGTPKITGLVFMFAPPSNALVSGLLYKGRNKDAAAILLAGLVVMSLSPIFSPLTLHWLVYILAVYDKVVAVAAAITYGYIKKKFRRSLASYVVLGFVGIEADNITGNAVFSLPFIYGGVFGLPESIIRGIYVAEAVTVPLLRVVQSLLAGILVYSVLKLVKTVRK